MAEKKSEKVEKKDASEDEDGLMHSFSGSKSHMFTKGLSVLFLFAVLLGVGTGFMLAKNKGGSVTAGAPSYGNVSSGKTFGSDDTKTFKDTAEGTLEFGGVEGEGQFHLVRPGGDSQNVYLTSALVDLAQFKGKKIKVWGQTQTAKTAGWLMDVGRVEVL